MRIARGRPNFYSSGRFGTRVSDDGRDGRLNDLKQDDQGQHGDLQAFPPGSPSAEEPVRLRPTRHPRHRRRWIVYALLFVFVLCLAPVFVSAFVINRLAEGPIALDMLRGPFANALAARMGDDYVAEVGPLALEDSDHGPRIAMQGFSLKDPQGRTIIAAPKADVSIDPLALLWGRVSPRRLELMELELRLSVLPNGSVALSIGSEPIVLTGGKKAAGDSGVQPNGVPDGDVMLALGEALKTLLDTAMRDNSPAGVLKRVGVSRGHLVFDDQSTRQQTRFEDFELDFDRAQDSAALLVSARGPSGRWRAEALANGRKGEMRTLDISLTNFTLKDLQLIAGVRDPGFDFTMPVSSQLNVTLGTDHQLTAASGRFATGSGTFVLDDKDHQPVHIDQIEGTFEWNASSRRFDLNRTLMIAGETRFAIAGAVTPPPAGSNAWHIVGRTIERSVWGAEGPNQKPVYVDRSQFDARYVPIERRLLLDRLELVGPDLNLATSADAQLTPEGISLRLTGKAGKMSALAALRVWPTPVAPRLRAWFTRALQAGTLEDGSLWLDFDPATMKALQQDLQPPDDKLRVNFRLSGVTLVAVTGLPPFLNLDGTGVVTGRTANFVATRGLMDVSGQKLNLVEASVSVPDTQLKPAPASINMRMNGPLEAVADLFERDRLKPFAQVPIDAASVKGHIDGSIAVDLKLADEIKPDDTRVRASAALTNFSVDKLVGTEKLEAGSLNLTAERGLLRATGQGRLFGAPATIELRKQLDTPTQAIIGMTLDDAARSKLGLNFGQTLTGQIGAKMTAALGQQDKPRAQVEIDFTRANIDNLLPGLVKPAGRPAKASFILINDLAGPDLENFVFESGTAYAKGTIELDPIGGMERLKLSQVRLSAGDDMQIIAEQSKDILKLSITGKAVDAKPFLRLLTTGTAPRAGSGPSKDFDVDLKANNVIGYNNQSATNVTLRMGRRAGQIRIFTLNGKFGKDIVTGSVVRMQNEPQISIATNDGGALLSFFDFYKRMEGGRLQFTAQLSDGEIDGTVNVQNFVIRNEPALRRLVSEGVAQRDRSGQMKIDTTAAAFTKLQLSFTRGQGRIELRDGVIYGPESGSTIEGTLDTVYDRVNMTGTFVPAYGLNNFFSKIPLFGVFLGGGANEGLFGINFRISGPATAPVLTINPLSALAPGFLRKIFGAGEALPGQAPAPAANVPPGGEAPDEAQKENAPKENAPLPYAPTRRVQPFR